MSFLESLSKFLFGTKKQIRHIDLDPESIKTHNTIRALANENASLKGELARLRADLGELRESEKDLDEEDEVKIELNNQKKELDTKSYPEYFSLGSFFRKMAYNKKFREKLGIYSFDRSKKLAGFGDIGFSSDGDIVMLDNNRNPIIKRKNLKDIFQSVGALGNDVQSFKIPINLDEEFGVVENLMVWEAAEITPTEDGEFKYTKARKKPFYKYIQELMGQIQEQHEQIEALELTNTQLQQENDELNVSQRVAEDSAETSRVELGKAEKSVSSIERIFRGTERELSQLRDMNVILEDNLDKLSNQVEKLRSEAEREGSKLSFDDAMGKIDQIKSITQQRTMTIPSLESSIIQKIPGKPIEVS